MQLGRDYERGEHGTSAFRLFIVVAVGAVVGALGVLSASADHLLKQTPLQ